MRCPGCPNPDTRSAGTRGPLSSDIAIVGMCPGENELTQGEPFVGGSGRLLASALSFSKVDIDEVYLMNVVNCSPLGPTKGLTNEQLKACRSRLAQDVSNIQSKVVIPLGGEALQAITGFKGPNNGISSWRGYIIDPTESMAVGPLTKAVVPSFHPSFIRRTGLRYFHYLARDINRATRMANGSCTLLEPRPTNDPIPTLRPDKLGIDIETKGFSHQIEQIGLAW